MGGGPASIGEWPGGVSSGGGGGQRRAERGQADQHQHGLRGGEHRGEIEITVTSNHVTVQNTQFSSNITQTLTLKNLVSNGVRTHQTKKRLYHLGAGVLSETGGR